MGLQSWMIKSWPIIEWKLPIDGGDWPTLLHAHTNVREGARSADDRRNGETVWIGVVDGKSIGAAWEWTELRPGVVMISDPNSIVTNVRFLNQDDTYQEYLPAVISMNRLAHVIPWQTTVSAILAATREHPEMASRHAPLADDHGWLGNHRSRARSAYSAALG